ncbi:hypothetical protein LIER_19393 [Lithospermum erythrorhizon]|uniref:Reverse transcriptase domain-containing protein n=1 Tax=Lithospermum erythrorhizon TaxID=34254 RepID=A0AAV3QHM6_LITER
MFNELLNHRAMHSDFTFHPKCKELGIASVCFADDMFILSGAFGKTIEIVSNALKDFGKWSGLKPNLDKSTMYIAGLEQSRAQGLNSRMAIAMGSLLVRYIRMPLITKLVTYGDYKPLIERITKKIEEWGNHYLSFAGRLVLINSSIFEEARGSYMPKVSWKNVAMRKKEGGVDIKYLRIWNQACMEYYVWDLCNSKESLWVRWIVTLGQKGIGILADQFGARGLISMPNDASVADVINVGRWPTGRRLTKEVHLFL